uniref:NfeD family protein n=1 Tax=uncultured miscellaneous Crenarchaeota group TaxID=1368239 RepID=W8S016_9ARCH|nr:nfeD family protein [uncultured miscellaneous Crenarchaeota group]
MLRLKYGRMRLLWRAFSFSAVAFALAVLSADGGGAQRGGHAVRLIVNGPIGPAVADYIHRGLEKAVDGGATVVILQMDTPGGLDTSMREIIKDILASPVPVIGYVGPSGARAASAGTYMLYAAHVAAMAPATNLGAATPVQMGAPGTPEKDDEEGKSPGKKQEDEKDEDAEPSSEESAEGDSAEEEAEEGWNPFGRKPGMEQKVMQDAVAYIKSLAQKRGRNAEWAVKAVTEAASLSAEDALAEAVINFIAESPAEALEKADGMTVDVQGADHVMRTAGLAVVELAPDWRTEFLEIITDPTVAYLLLFTIGIPALMIELYTGTMIAGVIAAISIILGLYGLHVLPINFAGAGLILLGLALLVAEAFVPSVGVLGIGGVISFVIGSVMLIETDVPGFGISPWLIGSVATAAGAIMLLVVAMIVRSRGQAPVSGHEAMLGASAIVVDWSDSAGSVRFQGEIWRARSTQRELEKGTKVVVVGREALILVVEPAENRSEGN